MFLSDINFVIVWWLVFFIIGMLNIPLTWYFFRKFTDNGYAFSKVIGSLLVTYLVFIFGVFKISPFSRTSVMFFLIVNAVVNLFIFFRNKEKILASYRQKIKFIIFAEILFLFGVVLWSFVRGNQPNIEGLEKFMDYGFIKSLLRSRYLPPADMWAAGNYINYYWFGHLWVAVLTKLSNIPPKITYNLMLSAIMGITLSFAFSIASTLVKFSKYNINKKNLFLAGFISAVILTFGGNFHAPYFVLKDGSQKYWYPDATRFIGYNPDTNDKTIHEFPQYSYIVSDLHAHLINLPFALLYFALLLKASNQGFNVKKISQLVPLGFLMGVQFMSNTWDFGNLMLASGIVIGLANLKYKGINIKSFIKTAVYLSGITGVAIITLLPFYLNFVSIAQGVALVNARSPLWQLSILWGFPAVLTVIFLSVLIQRFPKVKRVDLFVLSILIASWILIFLPEFIYVKDIYIASHHRANTMFKLTYQAFVMFYTLGGYIVVRTITYYKKSKVGKILPIFFIFLISSILIYPYFGVKSYYGELKVYKGLDGEKWFDQSYPEAYAVVNWLNKNVSGQPVILEAPGDSYTQFNAISAYTGLPTISGWFVHEWLWRGTADFPQERVGEITEIYTSYDINKTLSLLRKYKVEYVIVGTFEREKFPDLYEQKFLQIGKVVFTSGTTKIYDVLPALKSEVSF
ncbi:hypothetical protein A2685_03085 [Candidatus Woesebacteria bacterium RIFCSPHIGHO2_01_FULL_37_10]|uniref:YYY membrane protein n=1 Tax=Candidatus Woesebacteria bacterium RIFCSPHIGHO2_01_FULL_37_10 TaxID=1802489 RepID=A0A1F7XSP6_9BACT|nr:MAG: hypothetical protein A2685_03085 [Candidatus Woesebacteria bacterium RIFCSPHIGHO2_01_FULL_37_10]